MKLRHLGAVCAMGLGLAAAPALADLLVGLSSVDD